MYDLMRGIKVVEVASYLFVPAAAAILADWGADVVRVEHPVAGDPFRETRAEWVAPGRPNTLLQMGNRGKRSIGLDVSTKRGRELLYAMVAEADVFLTNLRDGPRFRLGCDFESIKAVNSRIVYGRGSGYGPRGPLRDKPGFDSSATWARAGFLHRLTQPNSESPVDQPGSVGDLTGALAMAGGIAAGLFQRERTGEAQQVDVSLYGVGMWIMSQSISAAPHGLGSSPVAITRRRPLNPIANVYRTADDRWLRLTVLQADTHWPSFCAHIDRPDLAADPRFFDIDLRKEHAEELVAILDTEFAKRSLEEWTKRLETFGGVWDPALSAGEVAEDEQALANDYFPEVVGDDGPMFRLVAGPVQFGGQGVGTLRPMPEHAQHTEEVLLKMGLDWDQIAELQREGII